MQRIESYPWCPPLSRQRADHPLLGLTILMVEDSKYFSDAIRLMSIRSGARLRRADCLQSASKHLRIYRPDVVLLDMGLPDGSGLALLEDLHKFNPPPPIIAMSGDDSAGDQSVARGANCFIAKPFFDIVAFQQTVLGVLPDSDQFRPFFPRFAGKLVYPDDEALREDFNRLHHMLQETLSDDPGAQLDYCIQFLSSIAHTIQDSTLEQIANDLTKNRQDRACWRAIVGKLLRELETRLAT